MQIILPGNLQSSYLCSIWLQCIWFVHQYFLFSKVCILKTMCITSLLQLYITTECTVRDFLLCSTLPSPYLHKKQLIPETRVIFCWVFFLNQAERTLLALEHNAFLKTLNIDIVWLSMILTAKISSYMRTTFSFKGFLEDDVLLSSPAFFSTWDMIKSKKKTTVKRHIYLICLFFSAAPFKGHHSRLSASISLYS